MSIIISILLSSFTLLLGIAVLVRGTTKLVNRLFFLATLSAALWALNFQKIESYSAIRMVDFTNSLSYILGLSLVFSVVYLSYYFPVERKKRSLVFFSILLGLTTILSPTGLVKGTVYRDLNGSLVFKEGPLNFLYSLILIAGILLIIYNLNRDKKKFTSGQRAQARLIAIGSAMSFSFGFLLTTIAPIFNAPEIVLNLAPFSVVFFLIFTTIAISKHKLFDFRAVLVRALTYLFTTLFVTAGYVVLAFLVKKFTLSSSKFDAVELIQNIVLTVTLILTFPFIKRKFDRITDKLFFRDEYDPQILIDKLNQTLVTNIELEELLTKSALVLQESIKLDFCTFYIRETSYFPSRIIGAHRKDPEIEDIDSLETHAARIHRRVHSVEIEPENDDEKQLSKALKSNDIEVMARLVTTLDFDVKGIGYIFFGHKKNGSQYTAQDLKILEIVANELVIAIENALRYEEIEQFNVTLQKKIDDATKELKESNEKLKALDEAKDEFVSMASHQLRTPLTSIKGYISMVLEGDAGKISETQAKMLGQAFFSSQRMVYLISDLLNVSRLKTGKFVIESKPVYLPGVVESEINQLVEGASAKNLTLSFTKPKEFSTMLLDEMKIRQVIMNFTDNAIYYTPSGGKITITLKDNPKSVEFTVKDNGIGVPKEQQHKLFVKFYRADNARKARPDGTGLGLFMAKKVIIAQGGSMIFESTEGKGSTFGFTFPKEKLEVKPSESQN